MKTVIVLVVLWISVPGMNVNNPGNQQFNICELKGSVYIEEFPEHADFHVFEEDSEAFTDLLIFETDNALYADRPGVWYFTDQAAFADFTIYFVESEGNADFSVYFTSFESLAGCNN